MFGKNHHNTSLKLPSEPHSLKRDVIHGATTNPLPGNSTMQTFKSYPCNYTSCRVAHSSMINIKSISQIWVSNNTENFKNGSQNDMHNGKK